MEQMQEWELERRAMPEYLLRLRAYRVYYEKKNANIFETNEVDEESNLHFLQIANSELMVAKELQHLCFWSF